MLATHAPARPSRIPEPAWHTAAAPCAGQPGRSPCEGCGTRRVCAAARLDDEGHTAGAGWVGLRKVSAGEAVYRAGDPFRSLYVPRAGSCKSLSLNRDGRQQITRFHLGGEVMGMDGIASGRHETEAIALEDSMLCVLPYRELEVRADHSVSVHHTLQRLLSEEIVRSTRLLMLMNNLGAEERLAMFLSDLAERYAARGYSTVAFNLRMSREEIGLHLGMTLETVSRALSRLQARGLIERRYRQIRIVDPQALRDF